MSLWAEIKQRRITQIVLGYLAAGWMVLEIVAQLVDREVLPVVVYEVGLTVYVIGTLAALVIGWYHGERGEQRAPLSEVVMLGAVAVLALVGSGMVVRTSLAETDLQDALETDDLRSIAVLYLDDVSSDGSMQAVADGITEGLIGALSEVRELDVTSRNGAREARDLGDVPPDSVARVLGVGALVDGNVDVEGDELRLSIRLLEGQTGQPLFREAYRRPMSEVTTVGTDLAAELARVLREQLGVEIRLRESRAAAPNAAAWLQVARAERHIKQALEAVQHGDAEAMIGSLDAAEAELIAAQASAPEWAEPLVLRSQVAYEGLVLVHDPDERRATSERAVEYADAALRLDAVNAAALEWRGTARYRRWLDRIDDEDTRETLFARAHDDLERARRLAPNRASVNSTLSHLYYQIDDWAQAVIAARTAYEQDAFLDVADGVLWRLFTAYYDLGELDNAERTCEQGADRFPFDFRFVQCRLFTMTMPSAEPDVDRAWALHDELQPLLVQRPEFFEAQSRMIVAAILGRAGLADSASAVFEGARTGTDIDPEWELVSFEAAMRSVTGDVEGSIDALERFMVVNPEHAPGEHWWWRNLRGDPEFERFRAMH